MITLILSIIAAIIGHFTHDPIKNALATAGGQTRVVTYRSAKMKPRGPRKPRAVPAAPHDPTGIEQAGA